MASLNQAMQDFVANNQCFIATVSKEGIPNVGPKRSTRVLNEDTLIFTEGTGGATYQNIVDGSKIAIAVVNREILDGYRFVGQGEVQTSGDLYEQAATMSQNAGLPRPKAVVLVHIEEIHSLKPGPTAGKKI